MRDHTEPAPASTRTGSTGGHRTGRVGGTGRGISRWWREGTRWDRYLLPSPSLLPTSYPLRTTSTITAGLLPALIVILRHFLVLLFVLLVKFIIVDRDELVSHHQLDAAGCDRWRVSTPLTALAAWHK